MSTIPSGYDSTVFLEKEALAAGITVGQLYSRYMTRGWSIERMVSHNLLKQTAIPVKGAPLASDVQVGGNHYKQFPIQPAEFSERNKLSFLEASVVKRVCRHSRGGKGVQDIDKAIHELQLIKEYHYGGATTAVQNTDTDFTVDNVVAAFIRPAVPAAVESTPTAVDSKPIDTVATRPAIPNEHHELSCHCSVCSTYRLSP